MREYRLAGDKQYQGRVVLLTSSRLNMRPEAKPGYVVGRAHVRLDSNTNNCKNDSNHSEAEDAQEGQLLL